MASQFEELTDRLDKVEKLLMQVIHMLGPRLDQDSLRAGIESEDLDFLEPEEGIWETEEQPDLPRTRVPYKTNEGGEAFVNWDSLDPEMKMVIEVARTMPDPWQLYESPSGQMRIAVSGEVAALAKARKLGNQTSQ